MEIKERAGAHKFTVAAGVDLGWETKLRALTLLFEGKEVRLNTEECDELRRVLDGKAMKVLAFRSKGDYEAHSAIYSSSEDKTSGTITVYMEDSIADKI
jgi:hypothetical protein